MAFHLTRENLLSLRAYIAGNLPASIHGVAEQSGIDYPLRHPYTSPCVGEMFREFYYWDTYFTGIALEHLGMWEQYRNNIENCFDLIDRLGFVPNFNMVSGANRSQPPFLINMVTRYFDHTGDMAFLRRAIAHLETELRFWYTRRSFASGLAHYGTDEEDRDYKLRFYRMVLRRTGLPDTADSEAQKLALSDQFIAEAESGWDFTPRFGHRAMDCAAVDLNSNLYAYELGLSRLYSTTGEEENAEKYRLAARNRLGLMNRWLWNAETGLFMDRNMITGEFGSCVTAASYFPLYQGVATGEQAESARRRLSDLLYGYGVATCAPGDRETGYQWDYPNGWPCLQIVVARGLANYGFRAEAQTVAEAFLSNVWGVFAETGHLWEKYNVADGSLRVSNEYEMPVMLGWTAGAVLDLMDILGE